MASHVQGVVSNQAKQGSKLLSEEVKGQFFRCSWKRGQSLVACLGLTTVPALLVWLIFTPKLAQNWLQEWDLLSFSDAISSCDEWLMVQRSHQLGIYDQKDYVNNVVRVQLRSEAAGGSEGLVLQAVGKFDRLHVAPGCSGIWTGLTPDLLLMLFHVEGLSLPILPCVSCRHSKSLSLSGGGVAQASLRQLGAQKVVQYINATLVEYLAEGHQVEALFGQPQGIPPWESYAGIYALTCVSFSVSAFGAVLVYIAQLRGRVQSRLEQLVLWYFTFTMLGSCLGGVGIGVQSCAVGTDLAYNVLVWMVAVPSVFASNLVLQLIMLVKLEGFSVGTDENFKAKVRKMRHMIRAEKVCLWAVVLTLLPVVAIPRLPREAILVLLGFLMIELLVFLLADLWFSLVSIHVFAGPLLMVGRSLRDARHQQRIKDTNSEETENLKQAFGMALLNFCASLIAVLSTTGYYVLTMVWIWAVILNVNPLDINGSNNPLRLGQLDCMLNDICTIVFADLLYMNFSNDSKRNRQYNWAIGYLGQQFALLQQQDQEQQAQLAEGIKALAAGHNDELHSRMRDLETRLRRCSLETYSTGDASEVSAVHGRMRSEAVQELNRLTHLANKLVQLHSRADARFSHLLQIQNFGEGLTQWIPPRLLATEDNGPIMTFLQEKADDVAPEFGRCVAALMETFNAARHPSELGLDCEAFPFDIRATESEGDAVAQVWGPKKTEARSWQKVRSPKEYGALSFPQAANLLDIERMQLQFHNPYALAVFFRFMLADVAKNNFRVVRVKNRFLEETPSYGYRDVLVNCEVLGFVVELQLTLRDLAVLKSCMHPLYKVERSTTHTELLAQKVFCIHHVAASEPRAIPKSDHHGATKIREDQVRSLDGPAKLTRNKTSITDVTTNLSDILPNACHHEPD